MEFKDDLLDARPVIRRDAEKDFEFAALCVDLEQINVIQVLFDHYFRKSPHLAVIERNLQQVHPTCW